MHESIFSYNLSRPYPYRWFTWVVFGGGIVAAALFTVINVAADGYNLSNVYSTNPNKTIEDVFWFQKQPWSWAAKVATTCQPETIMVGSSFYTDKMAFPYTVQNVTQRGQNGSRSQQPSFPYQNVGLNCSITTITCTAMNQTSLDWMASFGYTVNELPFVITVIAHASCSLIDDSWDTQFELTTTMTFDSMAGDSPIGWGDSGWGNNIHQTQTLPSVFWGQLLMSFYARIWQMLPEVNNTAPGFMISTINADADYYFDFGSVGEMILEQQILNSSDYLDNMPGRWPGGGPTAQWANDSSIWNELDDANDFGTYSFQWMNVINGFVKLVYCTVLSDLGQPERYNLLSGPESGQALVTQVRDVWLSQMPNETRPQGIATWQEFAGNLTSNYNSIKAVTTKPPLSNSTEFFAWLNQSVSAPTTPSVSTISAQYLCQVPQRKGWGSLIVSVLVADIVFLQVLWKLLCWITTFMVERENEQAKYCIWMRKEIPN